MALISKAYTLLPDRVQPFAKKIYYSFKKSEAEKDREIESKFIQKFFDSKREYRSYRDELEDDEEISNKYLEAKKKFNKLVKEDGFGTIDTKEGFRIYSLIRKRKPSTVVETGVCNGFSTMCILLALDKNEKGRLYSIDYPFRADESLEDFKEETFENYAGAAIPSGKDPGWIIPENIRDRWTLNVGKSQIELPKLMNELDKIDIFLHDSEHSLPCMIFEYEVAWHNLDSEGLIISDDINWNQAFEIFSKERKTEKHKLSTSIGILKEN